MLAQQAARLLTVYKAPCAAVFSASHGAEKLSVTMTTSSGARAKNSIN